MIASCGLANRSPAMAPAGTIASCGVDHGVTASGELRITLTAKRRAAWVRALVGPGPLGWRKQTLA